MPPNGTPYRYRAEVWEVECSGWLWWCECEIADERVVRAIAGFRSVPDSTEAKGAFNAYCEQNTGDRCPDWVRDALLLSVSADPVAETADVRVQDHRSGDTVTARFTLAGCGELVGAQDWIAGRIRDASLDAFVPTSAEAGPVLLLHLDEPA